MRLYPFIFIAILLSSCLFLGEETTRHYYHKCFFMGETSFLIEGETFKPRPESSSKQPLTEPIPFDSLVVRIGHKMGPLNDFLKEPDYYTEWEIPAIKLSESKFQLPVDITANGITIDKDIMTESLFNRSDLFHSKYPVSSGNPGHFPAFLLRFFFDGRYQHYANSNPVFYEEVENNKYHFDTYKYMYIAEPIDLSETYIGKPINTNRTEIHHYDFNFSKPGWYKIIEKYYREIDDDPTGEITCFVRSEESSQ